jgi:hypothetical protein
MADDRNCKEMKASGTISRQQEKAMTALLTCPSITAAAQQCGVAEVTLYRWLKQDDFQQAYRDARRQVVQGVIAQCEQAGTALITTLRAIVDNQDTPPMARIQAAKVVLDVMFKAWTFETIAEQEQRLAALEAEVESLRHGYQPSS